MGLNNSGTIRASYATGEVSGNSEVGGLVGRNIGFFSTVINSYFDTDTSGLKTGSRGRTTEQLQMPTSYTSTGIYADWNLDVDNADFDFNLLTGVDDPWDFGTNEQYPVLQVDFDGDGVKSWEEFGPQPRPGVFVSLGVLFLTEGTTGSYTVVLLTMPTARVVVTPRSRNTAAVRVTSGELIFTRENWDTEQMVTVRALNDANTANEEVSLTHAVVSTDSSYASAAPPDVTVRVTDNGANDEGIRVRIRVFLEGPLR